MVGGCASLGRRLALPASLQGEAQAFLPPDVGYEIIPLHTKDGTKIVAQFGRAAILPGESNRDPAHVPRLPSRPSSSAMT